MTYIQTLVQIIQIFLIDEVINTFSFVRNSWTGSRNHFQGLNAGIVLVLCLILIIAFIYKSAPKSSISLAFETLFETMFGFFEDILGKEERTRIKNYIITLFLIILLANRAGVLVEIIMPIFGFHDGQFAAHHVLSIPSATIEFNVAMAFIGVIIVLVVQLKHGQSLPLVQQKKDKMKYTIAGIIQLGLFNWFIASLLGHATPDIIVSGFLTSSILFALLHFSQTLSNKTLGLIHLINEYICITGKDILTVEKRNMSWLIFLPLMLCVKIFDIGIGLFLGFLDIIGLVAKIISLAFRLYGNMISGGILLTILMIGMGKIPAIAPVVVYAQEILVATIQAFVFALLVAIFIKVAQES